jgi:hypothetical protein
MTIASILQYATVFSVAVGLLSVALALVSSRQQLTTQICLTVFSHYDTLLESASAGFLASLRSETDLPEPSHELTRAVLRYYTYVAFVFFLYNWGRIPGKLWKLVSPSLEKQLRTPVFVREWGVVEKEFEHFPDFIRFVYRVQHGEAAHGNMGSK